MSGEIAEAWTRGIGVAFDGRVVEVFGISGTPRFHVREVGIDVKGPDRRGDYQLHIGRRRKGKVQEGAMFAVAGEDWPAFEALIGQVEAARRAAGAPDS